MNKKTHTIVISNEKGGTGKSTIAMHLAMKLLYEGFSVATVDMDGRQGTLTHYIENRRNLRKELKISLKSPDHLCFCPVEDYNDIPLHTECVTKEIELLKGHYDAIIIDTPGSKNYLFDEAHKFADTLITPISDSLVDLDVINQDGKAGNYASYIWEVKKHLASQGKPFLNWIVVGNKVSVFNSRNKNFVFEKLQELSTRYGFRVASQIKDRVIYRELFLQGLTVLDMNNEVLKSRLTTSHIAAKQEIRSLAEFICP